MLPEECNWIDIAMRGEVCDQICQYALSILEKVQRGTPFNAAYNSALNKLYHYLHNAEMIFDLAIALINEATKKNVHQMKEAEYIEYTMELAGFDYEDKVEVYHQIASHTYSTQEAQIQQLEQMNIRLYKECIMLCDEQNKTQKAHEIDAGYDLRYPDKDTLVLKPKSFTKINLKIALEIPSGAMVQIASWSSLASKGINVRGRIIDAGYTGDITEKAIEKPKEIGVIHSNIFQQELPQTVPNFSEIIGHSLPKINPNPSSENYYVVMEKLSQINMRQLEPQQWSQFKELIVEFADIFAENNNDLGRTNLV
ncbi:hypothetical protein G9A89_019449 [Geosiphon pyriformis]|nr:hypothetical protein G9A89_019449 [Geosiphon pyriformis]